MFYKIVRPHCSFVQLQSGESVDIDTAQKAVDAVATSKLAAEIGVDLVDAKEDLDFTSNVGLQMAMESDEDIARLLPVTSVAGQMEKCSSGSSFHKPDGVTVVFCKNAGDGE